MKTTILYMNTRTKNHETTVFEHNSESQLDQMRQRYEARNGHLVFVSESIGDETIPLPELDIDEDYD